MQDCAEVRKFALFHEGQRLKILAKWWDLPPTVGQIL
jgi:hypothetical protein